MGVVLDDDVLYHILHHLHAIFLWYDAERKCQQIRCCGIVVVEDRVRIEHMPRSRRGASLDSQELLVESRCHLFPDRSPIVGIAPPLFHQLQGADDICCGDKRDVGLACRVLRMDKFQLFRWYTPISILAAMDDTIFTIFLNDMLYPFLDIRIALFDGLAVAVLPPQHVAGKR